MRGGFVAFFLIYIYRYIYIFLINIKNKKSTYENVLRQTNRRTHISTALPSSSSPIKIKEAPQKTAAHSRIRIEAKMNDADVSKQIQQMVRFIRQEAEEKANEISVSAEEVRPIPLRLRI
jgi:hypothetical protein